MQRLHRAPLVAIATVLRTLPFLALYALAGCAEDYTGRDGNGIVIDSIRPTEGYPGTVFRLYGRGFSPIADSNHVFINGTAASVGDPASLSTLLVTVPYEATTGTVMIKAAGLRGSGPAFTVLDIPRIDLADTYTEGKTLTIIGDHFATDIRLLEVYFNGEKMSIYNAGKTNDGRQYLETPYPPSGGDNPISIVVVSEGIKSLPYTYTVKPQLNELEYFNNIDGNTYVSTTISLYGQYFGLDAPGNEIQLADGSGPFTGDMKIVRWSPYRIDLEAVATNSAFSTIAVVVHGVTSDTLFFRY
ncbi:IPT/TIG domain-containing protein [Parachryseolinea silvisoli]|uniref:IPT/TIG domain-containing protein n=1 Tax=Parachryseolinea silvisoli TaxID=2873601 RepID=UPI0022659E8E|nr:IPT/TIG domain-containing protein [Parachryseolinea silvisoli]MCD9018954.1 hypothetical protein [Parachryseolinea silvisoli]